MSVTSKFSFFDKSKRKSLPEEDKVRFLSLLIVLGKRFLVEKIATFGIYPTEF